MRDEIAIGADSLANGDHHERGVAHGLQGNPEYAVAEVLRYPRRDLESEAGLPTAARTGERHESMSANQCRALGQFTLASDQRRRRRREIRRARLLHS